MEFEQKDPVKRETEAGKPNRTGIPLQMKQSFERSSGLSLDDVRVHYHSALPARLGALAYTQGSQVYVAPGQERHLGHELGHVVQQKQGRVRATSELGGVKINTSPALEQEADLLCRQAAQGAARIVQRRQAAPASGVVQMVRYGTIRDMWIGICGEDNANEAEVLIRADPALRELYEDAAAQVPLCDFVEENGDFQIHVLDTQEEAPRYRIEHPKYPEASPAASFQRRRFIGALFHELGHAAMDMQYQHIAGEGQELPEDIYLLNMNLPPWPGNDRPERAAEAEAYNKLCDKQGQQLMENIKRLEAVAKHDKKLHSKESEVYNYLFGDGAGYTARIKYMAATPQYHYDVVLGEMMYHLRAAGLTDSVTYRFIQRMLLEANDRRHQRSRFNDRMPYPLSEWSLFSPSTWSQTY